ncbi:protein glxC [Arthrobacter sp. SLBN-112]|jgi:glutamate synthase domain-containing protein 3|uniref:GltB/FmdC/FwdC-like GXGXG domain-containing protein n=1 Tax=Arthrobacter sp. SLBN-112 TaxID=2768452 RepID=UPI0027B1672D|nr:protein glxC [Arthrobacter sp. SLBN-112]MDQ0799537.1 glutamate synthase domain-containing protein 3 [Arthrobacter sp. SLBN-112]
MVTLTAPEALAPAATPAVLDLADAPVRELNQSLHNAVDGQSWTVTNPEGKHSLAVGINADVSVTVEGHAGYYAAGMHQKGDVTINGNAGVGLAENIMSGTVHVKGDASQSAAATGHGGLVVIDGNAGARCGISMKGVDIVVGGNIGHMSAFMAQAGRLVVCGDAGDALGDSIYEARIYVQGTVASLGADCIEKPLREEHLAELAELLAAAGRPDNPADFKRYGSARNLYHFHVDNSTAY